MKRGFPFFGGDPCDEIASTNTASAVLAKPAHAPALLKRGRMGTGRDAASQEREALNRVQRP